MRCKVDGCKHKSLPAKHGMCRACRVADTEKRKSICSINECENPIYSIKFKMCAKHYYKAIAIDCRPGKWSKSEKNFFEDDISLSRISIFDDDNEIIAAVFLDPEDIISLGIDDYEWDVDPKGHVYTEPYTLLSNMILGITERPELKALHINENKLDNRRNNLQVERRN